ncbi:MULTISPECIES: aldo/keto reductase [Acidithiobacillus]|jgi:aryl-alcohol dehydrogenase-like predicted oxidoreductase|uniref:Aldo/keto reductase n=3 Tax=Acidithiobacillus caldus TaxID=33059 RepID=F9ZN48_ACICS|nr:MULTISPECIES: aldo/keto reductase [Acidithiobacillus]AEK58091.1 aldo/keto reductase [Acidithiobacillus caldus SM-1]AIA55081.1 putative aldo/keto reductase [Acidithiobacillus caldus ATCC 51756]AUW32738.1 aldo/keto reductase [Acidithiobacillus caldus]MBU2730299.1 aldo/keto reductase [Acidithiobacillus caldus]MBU2734372.1 aldo/keto reductase [Acidithiobacillus caldus ATCC 51756]
MEYADIASLHQVSKIALGTWAIGGWMWGGSDERDAMATIHRALDLGINAIDTAPVYGFGRAEDIVGKAIRQIPVSERPYVATKVGLTWRDGKVFRDSRPARLRQEVEDSLRRLGIDHIDLYFVHWPDRQSDFAEAAQTLESLRREGKIREIAVSNFQPADMQKFLQGTGIAANQLPYNLFERGIEKEILPFCHERRIPIVAYGALCRGLLSGKMTAGRTFDGDDLRRVDPKFQAPHFQHYLAAAGQLDTLAHRLGHSLLGLALRWLLDQPDVVCALWGARRPEQLENLEEALGWHLDADNLREIDDILQKNIPDPVGPEFMAPPEERPADL